MTTRASASSSSSSCAQCAELAQQIEAAERANVAAQQRALGLEDQIWALKVDRDSWRRTAERLETEKCERERAEKGKQ